MIIDLRIETAPVFAPLLAPSRYKGAHGGRGSGKSHFFAGLAVESCMGFQGTRGLCVREIQKSLKDSAKRLIEDKITSFRVGSHFDVLNNEIKTPGGGLISFIGMQDHTAETIMSLEAIDWVWVEQAETLSARSLEILRPTIRKPGSELWFSWNRRRKTDPVDMLLTGPTPPKDSLVVEANWRDNPWLPQVLADEREYDMQTNPDTYGHVWEGEYISIQKGAYYSTQLARAREQRRIGFVARDDLMDARAFWDLGVNDSTAIWIAQFVGKEIRVLDYIEGQGQPLAYYVAELRRRGYEDALCVLPHDGAHRDSIQAVRFEDHLKDAGFRTQTLANQGKGAAMQRIETARRLFPSIWFNEATTQAGLEALGWYHERRDDHREVGLGPDHDWSSHAADAFGLMCMAYEAPRLKKQEAEERTVYTIGSDGGDQSWLAN